jgi:hypothetical protein
MYSKQVTKMGGRTRLSRCSVKASTKHVTVVAATSIAASTHSMGADDMTEIVVL